MDESQGFCISRDIFILVLYSIFVVPQKTMSVFQRLGIDPLLIKPPKNYSVTQKQTKETFAFKWRKRDTYESEISKSRAKKWLFELFCNSEPQKLERWLEGNRKIILDAGCGSGFSAMLFWGEYLKAHDYLGIDIADLIDVAKIRFKEAGYPGEFLQVSLFELDFIEEQSIDIIFSPGVLHHTDNPKEAIKYLATKLKDGGRFLFYVYAKKAVIREFTDDYIRQQLQRMTNEKAWEALKPLTKLGIALGKMNIEIDVPEDIPLLGIKRGKIDLQRFFYWNICKAYYHPEFSIEEMNHINFDWFRPLNCHRHTKEEVIAFCEKANLMIEHINAQESGIAIVARKRNS